MRRARELTTLLILSCTPACYDAGMPENPEVVWLRDPPPAVPEGEFCVVSDEPSKKGFTVQYKGKPYYLCCKKCVRSFVSEPERYAAGAGDPHQSE